MKKVLFATTALIATAGVASADITLTGSAAMGLRYTEDGGSNNNANDTTFDNELDFTISASGTSDNGIGFGASMDLETSETDQVQAGVGDGDAEVYVTYNGLTVTFGDVGGQTKEKVAEVGYQGIGADDLLADNTDIGNYDAVAAFSTNGLTIGVSYGSDTEDMAVSVSGTAGTVGWSIASINDEDGNDVVELGLSTTIGAAAINGAYADVQAPAAANDLKAFGISVAYEVAGTTYTFAMSDTNAAGQSANYGVGFSTPLGGGLSFVGAIGVDGAATTTAADVTKADLGFTMAF